MLPFACTGNCESLFNVAAERALDLRRKMMKGAPGTVASHYRIGTEAELQAPFAQKSDICTSITS